MVGATCLYAVYDPVTRRCTMARAGHPPPAIIDPQGHVTFPDMPAGAPLGLGLGLVPFESVELELPEGSLLALYTDGLVETRDDDIDVGLDRLGAALAQTGSVPGRPVLAGDRDLAVPGAVRRRHLAPCAHSRTRTGPGRFLGPAERADRRPHRPAGWPPVSSANGGLSIS